MAASEGLRVVLSGPRFESYRKSPMHSDLECLKLYVWNVALCEALYPTLQHLEICLRNAIHNAASKHFASEAWFMDPDVISSPKAMASVRSIMDVGRRRGDVLIPDQVVANLHLGFWTHLFSSQYEVKMWRGIIKHVFPNATTTTRSRKNIAPLVRRAQWMRNRVFHHEPVWHMQDLAARHREMLTTIAWISTPALRLARITDRFATVHSMDLSHLDVPLREIQT